jgi:excisionase family DNA binding protein
MPAPRPLDVCSSFRGIERRKRHQTMSDLCPMSCSFGSHVRLKTQELLNRAMGYGHQAGLSAPQAAQVLGVSLGTVCRWSDVGHLESFRTKGGQRRFSQEQLDRFIGLLERQHVDPLVDRKTG